MKLKVSMTFLYYRFIDCFFGENCYVNVLFCGEKDASNDEIMMRCPLDPRANN